MHEENQAAGHPKEADLSTIFDLILGPVRMAVLEAALEMDMPGILSGNNEPTAIGQALGLEKGNENLIHFLDAMVSLGFARKENGKYANTAFAESYLNKKSATYLGGLVGSLCHMQLPCLAKIPELIRNGPPSGERQDKLGGEALWAQSGRDLVGYHKAGMADRVADLLAALPEFPRMKRMLDLGCGPGVMCMRVVSRHHSLKGALCDQPPILRVAREEIARENLESRISTIPGDYNEVEFGTGYDLILASHSLYFVKDFDQMFSRIHSALNPGGVFVSLHEGLSCENTQPPELILSRLSLALRGQGFAFRKGQIASHLSNAGFATVESRSVMLLVGPTEMVIARKGVPSP